MGKRPINMKRLFNMPDEKRITRAEAADIMGCSPATIAAHNYAAVLPYGVANRPITIRVGDLKRYAKFMANGGREKLHLTMRVKPEDCPMYSRLYGVQSLTFGPPDVVLSKVVEETTNLFQKYHPEKKKRGQ